MAEVDHARALLRVAHRDLNALIGMLDSALFADEIVGFHAQQAVEKAIKAWLSALGEVYPMTHELTRLFTLLEGAGVDATPYWPLARLTPFAVQARYEECLLDGEPPLDRASIVAEVERLLNHVAGIL